MVGDLPVKLEVSGDYPYQGDIRITLQSSGEFALHPRIPQWCGKSRITLNGQPCGAVIRRHWQPGDTVEITLDMPVQVIFANQKVTCDQGRIALKRGPLIYALEEIDQKCPVRELLIVKDQQFEITAADGLPTGTAAIRGKAFREILPTDELYFSAEPQYEETLFCAVPYALWGNRGKTNMRVWNRYR